MAIELINDGDAFIVEVCTTGTEGLQGPAGPSGEDGKTAYQSYLDTTTDDPVLTEEEWSNQYALKQDITDNVLNTTDKTVVGAINELDVNIQEITYDTVGVAQITVPVFTNNGDGTIDIESCLFNLRSDSSHATPINMYTIPALSNVSVPDGVESYIVVQYNSGSPEYYIETDPSIVNGSDNGFIYSLWRRGVYIHSADQDSIGLGFNNKSNNMMLMTQRYRIAQYSELAAAEISTPNPRTITVTGADVYSGVKLNEVLSFNSSTDMFTKAVKNVGGTWDMTSTELVYSNTDFNPIAGGLTALGNNKWTYGLLFRSIGDVKETFWVLGQDEYNSEDAARTASESSRADLPIVITGHCLLVGRFLIQKDAVDGVTEPFKTSSGYFVSPIPQHNSTTNIQGGVDGDRQHLTTAQLDKLDGLTSSKWLGNYTSLAALEAAYPDPGGAGYYGDVDTGLGADVIRYIWDVDDSSYIQQLGESNVETAESVKVKYESNANTEVFETLEKSKLAGIEDGATANDTDANLRNRSTHTGTQLASTISDFETAAVLALGESTDEPTGFHHTEQPKVVLDFNNTTRVFSTIPLVDEFYFYHKGKKITTTGDSLTIPDTTGIYYIYYDTNGDLQYLTSFSTDLIEHEVLVAIMLWKSERQEAVYIGYEVHGLMDNRVHTLWHLTFGTAYISGMAIDDVTADASGDIDSHAQFSIGAGEMRDEDITIELSAQTLPAEIPVFYKEGISGDWDWNWSTNNWLATTTHTVGDRAIVSDRYIMQVTTSGTTGASEPTWNDSNFGDTTVDGSVTWTYMSDKTFPVIGGLGGNARLMWNESVGGTWQLTEVTDNDMVLMHIFASNNYNNTNQPYDYIAVLGQNEYNNTGLARAGANEELANLITSGLPFAEFVPIATVIYQTDAGSHANTPHCKIRTTDTGEDFISWLNTEISPSTPPSDHGNLTGLSGDDHTQYGLLQGRTGGQVLNGSDTTGEDLTLQDNPTDGNNITVTELVADNVKLATIETNADVTDNTNVNAAGAVMNSDTTTVDMNFVIDEDDMVSDSATKVPTQQSVKAYVDASGSSPVYFNGYFNNSTTAELTLPYVSKNTPPALTNLNDITTIYENTRSGFNAIANGNQITIPSNGDYRIINNCQSAAMTQSGAYGLGWRTGTGTVLTAGAMRPSSTGRYQSFMAKNVVTLSAGDVIEPFYWTGETNQTISILRLPWANSFTIIKL